jgi:hypothetical protein
LFLATLTFMKIDLRRVPLSAPGRAQAVVQNKYATTR